MILYIADENKISKYRLPEEITESILVKYQPFTGTTEYFLNIYAESNKWCIKNTSDVTIISNENGESTVLTTGTVYTLKLNNCAISPLVFCMPTYQEEGIYITPKVTPITIGSTPNCLINYQLNRQLENTCTLTYKEGNWYINTNATVASYLYLNDNIVTKEQKLTRGDVIITPTIKIIWMQEFMKLISSDIININNQLEKIIIKGIDVSKYANMLPTEDNISIYHKDDYFFHRPRLQTKIEDKIIDIDAPPKPELKEELPFILDFGTRFTMIAFSVIMVFNAITQYQRTKDIVQVIPSILMCVAMIIGSVIFPIIIKNYQKHRSQKREKYRIAKYTAYLDQKKKELDLEIKEEQQILLENNPSEDECYQNIIRKNNKLWNREIKDHDFLTIRLGLGTLPIKFQIKAPEKHFELDEDQLFNNALSLVNNSKTLYNVPITTSLVDNNIIALICNEPYKEYYLNNIMLQIIASQSSKDLKIITLTSESNKQRWKYLLNLPHSFSDDYKTRYFATTLDQMKKLSTLLETEYHQRQDQFKDLKGNDVDEKNKKIEGAFRNFDKYYLIIIDNYKDAKRINFIANLLKERINYGFSILFVADNIQSLPNSCDKFIYLTEKNGCLLNKELSSEQQEEFNIEYNPALNMESAVLKLANIPIEQNNGLEELPTVLPFLDMYDVGRMEQLNIINRWQNNDPINTLQAPVGLHVNGDLFELDLHEKAHGPHGLIAGSTGSGKSEFIITYILSMAINFHPDYVQFVLIDYKGGGLAGAFENKETNVKLPHIAGTITNLDKSEMNRAMVSIESELKRRQQKFNTVRDSLGESTIDIYKYQRLYKDGLVKEAIPHLFIISDEFAELKQQQPDFMSQLISTARIGRSLGLHLILATQKPSGVVNDQIWSNSRFKVCLRVQTKADSMEMLKREEAANIKETGRFYLQVGYNEIFEEGQSAWTGAKYFPNDKVKKKQDNSLNFINDIGESIKKVDDIIKTPDEKEEGEQITNIVKYLIAIAHKENIETKNLWLEPLKDKIYIKDLEERYNYTSKPYQLEAIIGEYDNPEEQTQGLVTLNYSDGKNLLIYGASGSGKDNLIYTIISSLIMKHTTDELNIYIIDYASENMKTFDKIPQVGDVIYSEDTEKLANLLAFLDKEIDKRKNLFANYMGSYKNYIASNDQKIPQLLIIISGYDNLIENNPNIYDRLNSLFKDSSKYGIYFTISTTLTSAVRYRVSQLFQEKICLQLTEPLEYRNILNAPRNLVPATKFGRGLMPIKDTVLEFQTAILCDSDEFVNTIRDYAIKAKEMYKTKAPAIKVLPKNLVINTLLKDLDPLIDITNIPLGIKKSNLEVLTYNFNQHKVLPIIANFLEEEFSFIKALVIAFHTIPNIKIRILDFSNICKKQYDDVPIYQDNFDTVIQQVDIELDKDETTSRTTIFFFVGIGNIKKKISPEYHIFIDKVFSRIKDMKKNIFIITDDYISYKNIETESWYNNYVNKTTGIWLGDGIRNQTIIKVNNAEMSPYKVEFKDMAYLVVNSKATLFKHIIDSEVEDE